MATIFVTIPDVVLQRVFEVFVVAYNYNPVNDISKAAFAKKYVARFITEVTNAHEVNEAATTARTASLGKASNEIVIA